MEQIEIISEIREMERRIADLISSKLSDISSGWQVQRIPQPISITARKRMEQDGTPFEENLSLGDEIQILIQKNNWDEVFGKIFIGKDAFPNQDELKVAFSYLSKIRNPGAHGKTITYSKEDLALCEIYLQKFARIIPETVAVDLITTDAEE